MAGGGLKEDALKLLSRSKENLLEILIYSCYIV